MAYLDHDHFISCIAEDFPHFSLSKNDLENPSQTFVRKYFSMMVQHVTRMPHFKKLSEEQREFVELTKEGPYLRNMIDVMNLYKMVKYIVENIGQKLEVRLSDILVPQLMPRRTYVLMGAMYEFYTTCAEFDGVYEDLYRADNKRAIITKLKEEQSALKKQLEQKKEESAKYREKVASIKQRLGDYASENEEVQNMLKDLHEREEGEQKKLTQLEEQESKEQDQFNKANREKEYYETLVVSDEVHMLENHRKLQEKKDKCSVKLQDLTKLLKESQTKISIFDKVLSLQEALNRQLRDEVLIGNKNCDLRSLYEMANYIQQECDSVTKEEGILSALLKERKEAFPNLRDALARLQTEKDSVTCQWEQRLQKYKELQRDLELSLTNWTVRLDITDSAMEKTRREIDELRKGNDDRMMDLQLKHKIFNEEITQLEEAVLKQLTDVNKKAMKYLEHK